MDIENLKIKYKPILSSEEHIPEYDLIETFFDRVEYIERQTGVYLFNFYNKEDKLFQYEINLENVYTDYGKWTKQFLIYFVMMDKIVLRDNWIIRNAFNNGNFTLPDKNIEQYLEDLKKKAFQFILNLALKEIELINENNDQFFVEQVENSLKSTRKKNLTNSLGLRDTGNFFITFLSSSTWEIYGPVVKHTGFFGKSPEGHVYKVIISITISFGHCDDKLKINFMSHSYIIITSILQDLEKLREKGKFIPIFTDSSIYNEPKITKLGEYNVIRDGDDIIYLAGSFIISPVGGYSLFEKSKLTIAGTEKILNISHSDLKAKINYSLMTK